MRGVTFEPMTTRIHHDQLATTFRKLLEIGRRHRMIFRWVGADYDCRIGIFNLIKGCGNGT